MVFVLQEFNTRPSSYFLDGGTSRHSLFDKCISCLVFLLEKALLLLKEASLTEEPFQVILSDWNMPTMTGIELLKACKLDPKLKEIPFILVTAESEQANIVEAIQNSVAEYIVKPFTPNTIKDKLEKVYLKKNSSVRKAG